jgi:hypothetical protein
VRGYGEKKSLEIGIVKIYGLMRILRDICSLLWTVYSKSEAKKHHEMITKPLRSVVDFAAASGFSDIS